jgi:hypothetical protein
MAGKVFRVAVSVGGAVRWREGILISII